MRLLRSFALLLVPPVVAVAVLNVWPSPASPQALAEAEARLLAGVQAPLEQRMVPAGEYALNTVRVGEKEKPTLVLLHGHGAGLGVFAPNYDTLATAYTVYAFDQIGWGRSPRIPAVPGTPEAVQAWWVESLEAWRRAVGLERFTLLGHSLGGFVAASYALAYPEAVEHLILVNAAGVTPPIDLGDGLYFHLTPQRVVRLAGPLGPTLVAQARSEDDGRSPLPDGALTDYYYQLSAAPPSGETAFLELIALQTWRLPLLDSLERLPMPVTIIWGEADDLTKPRNARLAHERIPRSELILLPGVGHIPQSEAPDAFHRAVLDSRFRAAGREPSEPEQRTADSRPSSAPHGQQ